MMLADSSYESRLVNYSLTCDGEAMGGFEEMVNRAKNFEYLKVRRRLERLGSWQFFKI